MQRPVVNLDARRILLGVTGGIAAYKALDLTRRLREHGAEVRVAMTRAATQFVGPLSFQALSGQRVLLDLLDPEAEAAMGHIELARWAERIVVAPASADFLARLAHGLADDLLTTLCLASEAPIIVAPAMNRVMWCAAATRANAACLGARGVRFVGPEAGAQACGETGVGRMSEPGEILAALEASFPRATDATAARALEGLHVVVTSGPTREPIDPVRFLSNRSSGRMGHALAAAALAAGARVTLVSGPTALEAPPGVHCIRIETAAELAAAVRSVVAGCDVFIGAAAVADWRPAHPADAKLKKAAGPPAIVLEPTVDVIAEVAARRPRPFVVGFAAETVAAAEHARGKLAAKGLDLIAANEVGPGIGFDAPDNALEVLWRGGSRTLPRAPKDCIARQLVDLIAERLHAPDTDSHPRSASRD